MVPVNTINRLVPENTKTVLVLTYKFHFGTYRYQKNFGTFTYQSLVSKVPVFFWYLQGTKIW